MVSAVNCAGCKYGYLLPRHPLDYSSVWECSDCDILLDNDTVAAKLDIYYFMTPKEEFKTSNDIAARAA